MSAARRGRPLPSRAIGMIVVVMLGSLAVPPTLPTASGSAHEGVSSWRLQIDAFDGPAPILGVVPGAADDSFDRNARGVNNFTGVVTNTGSMPATIRVNFSAPAVGWLSRNYTFFAVPSGASVSVQHEWSGPSLNVSEVEITMQAGVVITEQTDQRPAQVEALQTRAIRRPVQWHNLTLQHDGSWTKPSSIPRGGTATVAQVWLQNSGTTPQTVQLQAQGEGEAAANWSFATSPGQVFLNVGQRVLVRVNATAPGDANLSAQSPDGAGAAALARLHVLTSEPRVAPVRPDLPPYVHSVPFETPRVAAGESIFLVAIPPAQAAAPGNMSVLYNVSVVNPTTDAETIFLRILNVTDPTWTNVTLNLTDGMGQNVSLDTWSATIPAGSILNLTFRAAANVTALNQTWRWEVRANWTNETDRQAYTVIQLNVTQVFSDIQLAVRPNATSPEHPFNYTVVPGANLEVLLNLSHQGNGVETICVEAVGLPQGWTETNPCGEVHPKAQPLEPPSDGGNGLLGGDDGSMPPPAPLWNNTAGHNWSARLATWAPAGAYNFTFRATSKINPNATWVEDHEKVNVTVEALTFPAIVSHPIRDFPPRLVRANLLHPDVSPDAAPACVAPVGTGQVVPLDFVLENRGNRPGTFHLSVDVDRSLTWPSTGWTFVSTPEPGFRDMDPLQPEDLRIRVQAPADLEPMDRLVLNVTFEDINISRGVVERVACTVVASFPDLLVTNATADGTATLPAHLYTHHPATLRFHVSNLGWNATSGPVPVRSLIQGPGGFSLWQNHTVGALGTWKSGGWHRDLLVHLNTTLPGNYTYRIMVDPDDVVRELDRWGNVIVGHFEVRDFGIALTPPVGRTIVPEQTLAFEGPTAFRLRNGGAWSHNLTVSIQVDPPWRTFENLTVTLAPGQERTIPVVFTVPAFPGVSEVSVRVRASNQTLSTLAVNATTRLKIDDPDPPAVSGFVANRASVPLGGSTNFTATVRDATGVAEARVYVVGPDGASTWRTMLPTEDTEVYYATWDFDRVGRHTARVWARDGSVSGNQIDLRNASTISIDVIPSDRPGIVLVTPANGSAVRPGTPIVLTVLGSLPVVAVDYRIAGTDEILAVEPVTNPIQISTEGWTEGMKVLEVRARDAAGAEGYASFRITLDRTPPTVREISLDPPQASAGSKARIVARIDGAAKVALRLEDADGRTQEVEMLPRGSEAWSREIDLPRSLRTLVVVATDAAGNVEYAEKPFSGESEAQGVWARTVPAPVGALLVALLVALALAPGRRGGMRR